MLGALLLSSSNSPTVELDMSAQLPPSFGPDIFDWSRTSEVLSKFPAYAMDDAQAIGDLANRYQVHPALVFAIVDLESVGWKVTNTGVGGDGHGHRWWQIDDRSHADYLNANPDPGDFATDGDYAIGSVLVPAYQYAQAHGIAEPMATRFAVAAYNAGTGGAMKALQNSGDPNDATWHALYLPGIAPRFARVTI